LIKQQSMSTEPKMAPEGSLSLKDCGFHPCRALIVTSNAQGVKELVTALISLKSRWNVVNQNKFGMMVGSVTRDEIDSIDVERLKALALFRESGGELKRMCKKNRSPDENIDYFRGNTRDLVICIQFSYKTIKLRTDLKDAYMIIGTLRGVDALLTTGIAPRGGVPKTTTMHPKMLLTIPDVFSSVEVLMLDRAEQLEFQDLDLLGSILKSVNGD